MSQSEIARIQGLIAGEYVFIRTAFASTPASSQLIAQRQMKLAEHYNELIKYVSPQEAMKLCLKLAEENLYDKKKA